MTDTCVLLTIRETLNFLYILKRADVKNGVREGREKLKEGSLHYGLSVLVMDYCDTAVQYDNNITPYISDQKQTVITLTPFGAMLVTNGKLIKTNPLDILLPLLNGVLGFCILIYYP